MGKHASSKGAAIAHCAMVGSTEPQVGMRRERGPVEVGDAHAEYHRHQCPGSSWADPTQRLGSSWAEFKGITQWGQGHAILNREFWSAYTCRRSGCTKWPRSPATCRACNETRAILCTPQCSSKCGARYQAARPWATRRRETWWSSVWYSKALHHSSRPQGSRRGVRAGGSPTGGEGEEEGEPQGEQRADPARSP